MHNGRNCVVGAPIAKYVHTHDEFFAFKDAQRIEQADKARLAKAESVIEESLKKPDTKTLLKEIRHMVSNNHIKEGSGKRAVVSLYRFRIDIG